MPAGTDGGRIAARWADLFAVGQDECWLVLTNRRLALLVEGAVLNPPSGGVLGFGRSGAAAPALVTWWESPVSARFTAVPLGREVRSVWFVRVAFPDGSVFWSSRWPWWSPR